jgi:hypothetical protein
MRMRDGVRRSVLSLAMVAASLAPPSWAADTLWQERPGAAPPADIATLKEHLNTLAERLKPTLVEIRVRRAKRILDIDAIRRRWASSARSFA